MTTAANTRLSTLAVAVDWLGLTDFTDTYDDVTADVRGDAGVTIDRGKDGARTRSRPMVPSGSAVLDNQSRRYSAENAASPIYQLILPDRPARIQATLGAPVSFGSDWPVCLVAAESYRQVAELVLAWAEELAPAARAQLFGANAARIYHVA